MGLSKKEKFYEKIFSILTLSSSILVILIVLLIVISIFIRSIPAIKHFGVKFFFTKKWDPVFNEFGALPFIIGTLLTSFIAITISLPFSISIGVLLSEYIKKGFLHNILKSTTELLAGIPSVIYGFWGLFFLSPIMREFEIKIGLPPIGIGIFTASILLSIMIIPYAASITRESITLVPEDIKEAAFSTGATKFKVIKNVVIPYARGGIFTGIILSLGRALGETMAVTMVIGNSVEIPKSIFSPGNTIASIIANEFIEAVSELHISSLIELALILFIITGIINLIGRNLIKKYIIEVKH